MYEALKSAFEHRAVQ